MNQNKLEDIIKWYRILGDPEPGRKARYEIEHDTNMHSFQVFLRGAWEAVMNAISDENDQHEALFALCYYLDNQSDYMRKLGIEDVLSKRWAVFETDREGNPVRRLDGLHYYVDDSRPNRL